MTTRVPLRAFVSAALLLASSSVFAQSAKTYQYDARGRLVRATDGIGSKTDYAHDKANNRSNLAMQTQFSTAWEAEALPHQMGYADGNGWAANVTLSSGFMTYGPYSTAVPVGSRVATWRALVDNAVDPNNGNVITIDVYDATAGQQLASRTLTRHSWVANVPGLRAALRHGCLTRGTCN